MLMINHSIFHKFFRRKKYDIFHKKYNIDWVNFCDSLLPGAWATPPPRQLDWTRQPLTICQLKYFSTVLFTLVVHAVSLSSDPDLPRHEWHTELMASGGRQPARVLGTCWPQLWPGHTAAGGKRATLVPSFPPLSLSLHLPPLLSEHQSKSRRIRPKRYFMGLEIYIG